MTNDLTITSSELLAELDARGLIFQSTDRENLTHLLATPTSFFIGFDPTAESLHMGSLLQLVTARRLQLAGHRPVLLVGGGTGLIGDPKPGAERELTPAAQVATWTEKIEKQVARFVSFDKNNSAVLVNNFDWLSTTSTLDFLRNIGKHFSINRMLARDVVASRLEKGISFTEFSYMLLQGFDFLELFKTHDVKLQIGGSDQWGNIASGIELIRREAGGEAHGLTTPLLLKNDGTKFGKTENGTVWLAEDLTTPFELFQFLFNTEDVIVEKLLLQLTFLSVEEITELCERHRAAPWKREAQRKLAEEIVTLVHGEEKAAIARGASEALFSKTTSWAELSSEVLETALNATGAPIVSALPSKLVEIMVISELTSSKSAARRALSEGAVRFNGELVTEDITLSEAELLHDKFVVVSLGKKKITGLILK